MILAYVFTAAFCGVVCVHAAMRIRERLFKTLIFFGYGLIHGVAPALTSPEAFDTNFASTARAVASVFALFSAVALALGWSLAESMLGANRPRVSDLISAIRQPEATRALQKLFWIGGALGLIGMVLMWRATGATVGELADASRFEYRESRNPLLYMSGYFLLSFAFLPGFLGFFLGRGHRAAGVFYTITCVVLLFLVVDKGARATPIGLLGSLAVAYLLRSELQMKKIVCFSLAGFLLIYLAVGLYEARRRLGDPYRVVLAEMMSPEPWQDILVQDPLHYNEQLVGAVATFPSRHPFLEMATYRRMAFFFLPHSAFPSLKPKDANKVFAINAFGTVPAEEVMIPPSIPGDVYINFWGWPGLAVLLLYGGAGAWVDRRLVSDPLWFIAFGPQVVRLVCLGMRGQPYELFVLCLVTLGATYTVTRIAGCRLDSVRAAVAQRRREHEPLQPARLESGQAPPAGYVPARVTGRPARLHRGR